MLSHTIRTNKERELAYVRQATHDALTGCKNRRAFDNDVDELLTAHQPFVLALIDIDNFKSINDTWGHLSGDIVLRNGKVFRSCSRTTFPFTATVEKSSA
jgi:diguanylate cyclase (GGDEF)-like protein